MSATAISAGGQGTFGALLVNGGMTVTGLSSLTAVSASTISTTYLQLPSATTVYSCNSGLAGAMRYTSGTMQVCDGNNWGNIGIGVPTGSIVAFAASSCPNGWSEYTASRGRFLRGIDNGAGLDPSGTRVPGGQQADTLQDHGHKNNYTTNSSYDGYGNAGHGWNSNFATAYREGTSDVNPPFIQGVSTYAPTGATGAPRVSSETRPVNVAVTFCQYNGFQIQLVTGIATLASLSDVSVAGAVSGSVLSYNGSSWVAGTGGAAAAG